MPSVESFMKTCQYCKFEIPADALVCGHCRKNQPHSSVTKTAEQLKAEKQTILGCAAVLGGILVIGLIVSIVSSISDRIEKSRISAEIAQNDKLEQQSSTETAKAILPGINRFADIIEGKVKISRVEQKKEVDVLRALSKLTDKQSDRNDFSTAKSWQRLGVLLIKDSLNFESPDFESPDSPTPHFLKMEKSERLAAADMHRKLVSVFQKHANEGFVHCASLETDLWEVGGGFAYDSQGHVAVPGDIGSSDHNSFIRETSDLPSDVQRALDEVYKSDQGRARELSDKAHEGGVQNLPDR